VSADTPEIFVPSRDAVLNKEQLALALGVTVRDVERADLPTCYVTPRKPRYIYGQVLDALAERAA
jgi:hypothetical protein